MKKNILNMFLFISLVIGTSSTTNAQSKVFIGAESSLIFSGIENQNPYGIEKLPAVNTYGSTHSLLFGRHLKKGFELSLEPTYAQLGQNYLDSREEGDYVRNISLNYLQAGFYAAYLLSSSFQESRIISDGKTISGTSVVENSDPFNTIDFGIKATLGSQYTLSERLALNLSYNVNAGMSDLNSNAYQYTPGYGLKYRKSRNVYMGVNLGLQYSF